MTRHDEWTHKQIEQLKTHYPDPMNHVDDIATEIGRTTDAIRLKASRLGIKRDYRIPVAFDLKRAINNIELARAATNRNFIKKWLTEALDILKPFTELT